MVSFRWIDVSNQNGLISMDWWHLSVNRRQQISAKKVWWTPFSKNVWWTPIWSLQIWKKCKCFWHTIGVDPIKVIQSAKKTRIGLRSILLAMWKKKTNQQSEISSKNWCTSFECWILNGDTNTYNYQRTINIINCHLLIEWASIDF